MRGRPNRLLPAPTPSPSTRATPFRIWPIVALSVCSRSPDASSLLPHASLAVVQVPGQVVPASSRSLRPPPPRLHVLRMGSGSNYCSIIVRDPRVTPSGHPRCRLQVKHERAEDLSRASRPACASGHGLRRFRRSAKSVFPTTSARRLWRALELAHDDLEGSEGFTAFSDLFQLYPALDLQRLRDHFLARPIRSRPSRRAPDVLDGDPRGMCGSSVTRPSTP